MTIRRLEQSDPNFTALKCQYMTVHSSNTGRRHDISLYIDDGVSPHTPIIILLHGVYGSHWVWQHLGGVDKVYETLRKQHGLERFVLVMPSDGGLLDGSAYLPTLAYGDFEKWIMDDVLQSVTNSLPCLSEKSAVYLSGLSMGGYGALRLGAKYAERISGISAHSAITELTQLKLFSDCQLSHYQCQNDYESQLIYWFKKNLSQLPPLRFDCGKEDELYSGNYALHKQLNELNISHQFESFAGGHSWDYWHKHVADSLLFFSQIEASKKH